MQVLIWARVIVGVVLLFGAAVFVHEFGHLWVARRRGLKVDEFSIGFGPKVFGWTWNGIRYVWRWIPAGGFVKLPQMVTSSALEGKSASGTELPAISPASKVLVALAGPIMNIVFAFSIAAVIYFVGLPVAINPAVIGQVEPGSPEAKMGIRTGDRIVEVNGKPAATWEDVQMITALAATNLLPVTIEQGGKQVIYSLQAKYNDKLGLKLLDLEPAEHPVIGNVIPGSPAMSAGLKTGDEVWSFVGVPINGQKQLIGLIQKRAGEPSTIQVKRGQQQLNLTVTPRLNLTNHVGQVGMEVGPSTTTTYQLQKPGPAPWKLVAEICQQTFDVIGALVHSKQTGVGVQGLSGPPGILAALASQVKADYRLALKFMVLLNINLAILNLLPLPVLDGGHIAMALLEKLRGRPISPRVQEYATTLFAVLLISFMLYVSYNDVVRRLPLFRLMFNEQVHIEPGTQPSNAPAR